MRSKDQLNILLVWDCSETRPELEIILNQPGYYLVKVNSYIEAFRLLLEQSFSLILLRVLSQMDEAIVLIKRLAEYHDIPVVFV